MHCLNCSNLRTSKLVKRTCYCRAGRFGVRLIEMIMNLPGRPIEGKCGYEPVTPWPEEGVQKWLENFRANFKQVWGE